MAQHGPGREERDLLVTLLGAFVDDAHEGQLAAIKGAAIRAVHSEKAAPLREIVKQVDEANGGLFSRALNALRNRSGR